MVPCFVKYWLAVKEASPEANPASQLESIKLVKVLEGLIIGVTSGNLLFNSSDNPQFKQALILKISFNPEGVKWPFSLIIAIILHQSKKSTDFSVINGYF